MQWAGGTAWGWAALGKAGGSRVGGDLCGDPNTSLMCLLQSSIFSGFALLSSSGPHVSSPPHLCKSSRKAELGAAPLGRVGAFTRPLLVLCFGVLCTESPWFPSTPTRGICCWPRCKSRGRQQKAAPEMYRLWAHCPCVGWACKADGEKGLGGASLKTGVKTVRNL